MSLGAIDFGIIVDGSVVIIENIMRRLHTARARKQQVANLELIREASQEVIRPIAFAVGIIILVYVPILSLTGIEGKMFRPMAMTVIFALAGSLLIAVMLMPVLAFFPAQRKGRKRDLAHASSPRGLRASPELGHAQAQRGCSDRCGILRREHCDVSAARYRVHT